MQTEEPRTVSRGVHAALKWRELFLLLALSFVVFWTSLFLLHKSTHGHLFGWRLHGIVVGTLTYPAPWINLVLSFFWIGLVLLGVGMMFSSNFRKYAKSYRNEAILVCGLYLFAIFSYDYLVWARSNFIRFCIPTLPFVLHCCRFCRRTARCFGVSA